MKTRTHYILTLGLLLLAMLPLGCGSDDDDNGGGGGLKGDYEIFAGFAPGAEGDAATEEMVFVATVERLNSADPSAKTAVVKVDGTTIPLVTSGSTDAEATFQSTAIAYEPDAVYAVTVAIGEETASSTITAPDYESVVTITAPTDGATFTPGQALAVAWSYTGTTPAKAMLEVLGSTTTTDAILYEQILNGTTQNVSIPGTQTATWNSYADVAVAVGVGVTQTWSGSLASEGSYSFVLLSTDEVTVHPEGGAVSWTVTVTPASASIATGGTTTVTIAIEDDQGNAPPVGTQVNLSVSPAGAASISPVSVATNAAGTATATLTAGSTAGTVTVTAVVPSLGNISDQAGVTITGGGGQEGTYDISAGFVTAAETESFFTASVRRLSASDPSAMEATVTVNGTAVPLLTATANADTALFQSASIPYSPSTPYEIVVTLGSATATSSFTSPSYECIVVLTSPAPMSTFTPGVDIEAEWNLTGTNPPAIHLVAGGDISAPWNPGYISVELAGSARSYTVDTTDWTSYTMAVIGLSVGEYYDFTGALASEVSASYVNLTTDIVPLVAAGSGAEWFVTVETYQGTLQPNGTDTTAVRARVENLYGNPCPDGETVTFGISGPGTLTSTTAQTVDGWAVTTLTAGTEEGTVTITAEAFEQSDETTVEITQGGLAEYDMLVTFPELDPENPFLAPGASTTVHVSLKTLAEEQPCPNGTEITLSSQSLLGETGILTFGDTTLNTVDGEAETTVTAGSTVPLGNLVYVHAETDAVDYQGGIGVLLIMP